KVIPDAQVSSPPGLGSIPRAGQDLAWLGAVGWADDARSTSGNGVAKQCAARKPETMCGEHLLVGGIEWRARERAQIHREQIVPKARYGDLARVFTARLAGPLDDRDIPSLTEGQRAGRRAGQRAGRGEGQFPFLKRLSARKMEQTAGQTMGQTTTEPNTTEILLDLLKRAAQAHEFT